jgi:LuxR family transcriptional regulator, maltose regulon positive regulatory protein
MAVPVINELISTKFHIPLSLGRMTPRPRLDARLEESSCAGCRLVLVTAPAGFGKSTLISAWIQKQAAHYAWLSIDPSDNEPRQFLSYFVGALQKIDPSLGMSQVNRIQTADSADTEAVYADVIASLVNEIAALSEPCILALDDCHLIKNPTIFGLLTFLIEHQPATMRLVLLSREDLLLPVSRLRVRRQVIEIRQADLEFTLEETQDFLQEGMGISRLTSREIQALEQRTEGWIAGLQLAALSMKDDPDPARFIQSFTGSDRYILDYLIDEVFSHQSTEIQHFLLATSILDRFCAPLCAAVLEAYQADAGASIHQVQSMLALIERANLFLIPLDNQRQWFRYHHMFADLLRHALHQAAAEKVSALHLRASRWMEDNNFILEAVKHAFLSEDWQYAAELVERHAWNVILHSQVATVSEWCRCFPEEIIRQRPALCIFHAWALVIAFKKEDLQAANTRLEQAEAALAAIDPETRAELVVCAEPVCLHPWVRGQITLLRSFILMTGARRAANPQELIALGQQAYDQLPVEEIPARSASLLDICYASQANSDVEDAEKKFAQVVDVALSGCNYFGAVVAEYHRAHGLFVQGRLYEVIDFCEQKKQSYAAFFEHPLQELPALALLDQAQGCALIELNELAQAEQYLRAGLEVGQWMPREELPGYLGLARLCAAKGDRQGWADALRRLEMRWPDIRYCSQAMHILYPFTSNPEDPELREAASAWADSHVPEIETGILLPGIGPAWNDEGDYAVYTAWARVKIILGQPAEALWVIQPMLSLAQKFQLIHRMIDLSLLEAQALYIQGQKSAAWESVSVAAAHAEPRGYQRLIDQGPIAIRVLTEAAVHGIASKYLRRILGAAQSDLTFSAENEPEALAASTRYLDPEVLIEPLSSREIEVLAWMAQGLSNAEVAARLYLSPNTLKSHTQNIYGKLDVHSRVQAVNKARELKII